MPRTLWLIGMMGSGKTTVAPLVADALDREWVDTDDAVEQLTGRRITDLITESEAAFRDEEQRIVAAVAGEPLVVACGGGVVTRADAVTMMEETGLVVWLRARVSTLADRLGTGIGRPLLGGDDPIEALTSILDERGELYRAAGAVVVDTDDRDPDEIAVEVVRAWNASSEE